MNGLPQDQLVDPSDTEISQLERCIEGHEIGGVSTIARYKSIMQRHRVTFCEMFLFFINAARSGNTDMCLRLFADCQLHEAGRLLHETTDGILTDTATTAEQWARETNHIATADVLAYMKRNYNPLRRD